MRKNIVVLLILLFAFAGCHHEPRKANRTISPQRFQVVSDGRSGDQWLETLNSYVTEEARYLVRSKQFVASRGAVYNLVVISSNEFDEGTLTNKNIRAEAARHKYVTPPPEVALLLREKLSNQEIRATGFNYLVVMSDPITDNEGDPGYLVLFTNPDRCGLQEFTGRPLGSWREEDSPIGFVFLAPSQ